MKQVLGVLGIFGFVGLLVGVYLWRLESSRLKLSEGDLVRVTGFVSSDPRFTTHSQTFFLDEVKVTTHRFPDFAYGDYVVARGLVTKRGRGWLLEDAQVVSQLQRVSYVSERVRKYTISFRAGIVEFYKKNLPETHASLLSGITLGINTSLDFAFFEKLRNTGTLHIIVASGTNIALVGGFLTYVFVNFVRRRVAVFVVVFFIILYVFMVGMQPPILRAALMGGIAYIALIFGREFDARRALVITAIFLLLWRPIWLFDLGFQLSFLATLGILTLSGKLGKFGMVRGLPRGIRESLVTSVAAQIFVTPLLYFTFGDVSLIGPIVNVFVLPVVPFVMLGGLIFGVVGGIWEFGGKVGVWFVWLLLEYFIRVVELFDNFV